MVLEKKGMFFTMVAIALLSIVILSLTIISLSHERESVKKRVGILNDYVFSVEEDISRKLYISGFRIFFLFEKRIVERGEYLTDINTLFKEAFFNGTINGSANSEEQQLLSGVKYQEIIDDLFNSAEGVNLNLSFYNPILEIKQIDPWNVLVTLDLNIYIKDYGNLASWNRTKKFEAFIPIENFEDPIYLVNTNNIVVRKFIKTPYSIFANGSDVDNLNDHINNSYYFATNESPSFINRLEGNLTSNEFGVESFVNSLEFTSLGIGVTDKSLVDHVYFSSQNPPTKVVLGTPEWFKIDDTHISIYNLTHIAS
jgi:hypothetical protein